MRVVKPHMSNGYVLTGGAICMELLTPKGWNSAYTVEAVILQIASSGSTTGACFIIAHWPTFANSWQWQLIAVNSCSITCTCFCGIIAHYPTLPILGNGSQPQPPLLRARAE